MSTCKCTSLNEDKCITDKVECISGKDCDTDGFCKGFDCKIKIGQICYSGSDCKCSASGCFCQGDDCSLEKLPCYGGMSCICDTVNKNKCFCKNMINCLFDKKECLNPQSNSGCICDTNTQNCYCYTSACKPIAQPSKTFCEKYPTSWQCLLTDKDCHVEKPLQKCYNYINKPCDGPDASEYIQCKSKDTSCYVLEPAFKCNPKYKYLIILILLIFTIISFILTFKLIKNILLRIVSIIVILSIVLYIVYYFFYKEKTE